MLRTHGWMCRAIFTIAGIACFTNLAISQQRAPLRRPSAAPTTAHMGRVQHAGGAMMNEQASRAATAKPTTAQRTPVETLDGSAVVPANGIYCDDPSACNADVGLLSDVGTGCSPFWGYAEYLMWWGQDVSLPALATTSSTGTVRDDAGVLGLGSTSVLFGEDQVEAPGMLSGGRLTLGMWLGGMQQTGVFGRGFFVGEAESQFQQSTNGSTILARPFFNAFTGEQDALLLGFPNTFAGDLSIDHSTETRGAQALVRRLARQGCNYRLDFIAGYRYLGVDDALRIENSLEFIDPASGAFGTTIEQFDSFAIENEFHGGELGLMGHSVDGRWALDFLATVALGSMTQRATIQGETLTTPAAGNRVAVNGGLLTQQSNLGTFEDDPFAVIPEVTVTLGYFITPRLDVSVGYTFLYMSHVMRAGDAVDTAVNLTQQTGPLDGPARPSFPAEDSDYWLQGVNLGLNFRY